MTTETDLKQAWEQCFGRGRRQFTYDSDGGQVIDLTEAGTFCVVETGYGEGAQLICAALNYLVERYMFE
jgi:hypothetical protein